MSNESEEDSDLEQNESVIKKTHFTTMPRPQEIKRKKFDPDDNEYEYDSDKDELIVKPKEKKDDEVEEVEEEEEDDFQRQLRLEREEAERLKEKEKDVEKKTKKDPDGTEYEWDPVVKGWFPKLPDKQFIEYQSTNYQSTVEYTKPLPNTFYLFNGAFFKWDFENNKWIAADTPVYAYIDYLTGISYEWNTDENEWKAKSQPNSLPTAKSAKQEVVSSKNEPIKKKEGWVDLDDEKNTNVYVSNLPLDITDEEFEEMMSKYGIIMKDPSSHKLKIKLYRENDEVKGDGRCCYLMPESVKLCLQLLDGSDFKGKKVSVEKAKFEMKGNYDPTKAVKSNEHVKKLNKKKEKQLLSKQRQKLLDWEERPDIQRQKYEKVVVIKGLFTDEDIRKDPGYCKKLKEDMFNELKTYGDVKKVLIHENNPAGIATISFREVEMADQCTQYLNNRVWKNGRVISCETWDGETKYEVEETEEEQQRRIQEWHKFLESDE